jgi:hypothetical protein
MRYGASKDLSGYDNKGLYGHAPALGPRKRPLVGTGQPPDRPVDRSGYADAAASRTASVAHAGRRAVTAVVPASANGQYREQRS